MAYAVYVLSVDEQKWIKVSQEFKTERKADSMCETYSRLMPYGCFDVWPTDDFEEGS